MSVVRQEEDARKMIFLKWQLVLENCHILLRARRVGLNMLTFVPFAAMVPTFPELGGPLFPSAAVLIAA